MDWWFQDLLKHCLISDLLVDSLCVVLWLDVVSSQASWWNSLCCCCFADSHTRLFSCLFLSISGLASVNGNGIILETNIVGGKRFGCWRGSLFSMSFFLIPSILSLCLPPCPKTIYYSSACEQLCMFHLFPEFPWLPHSIPVFTQSFFHFHSASPPSASCYWMRRQGKNSRVVFVQQFVAVSRTSQDRRVWCWGMLSWPSFPLCFYLRNKLADALVSVLAWQ